jgi:hypothetical protein
VILSRPVFFATLRELFPELESLLHTDTLNRVLAKLDVAQLEVAHVETHPSDLVRELIHQAAMESNRDARGLSFLDSLQCIIDAIPHMASPCEPTHSPHTHTSSR